MVPVRLNFFVAFFQPDSAPMLPSVAVVGIVAVDNGELIIVWLVVIIPGNEESALGGALRSNGAPGVGVSRSDEDEELFASISACAEFGRGLE
jgi:hypothetical protein